jgi:hydroxysqualene synthase
MTALARVEPSKGHTDENFPVASLMIAPRHRESILAFYRFARAAEDIADHPRMDPREKLRRLDELGKTLLGSADSEADALPLRAILQEKRLSPRHALDLLTAFRQDVTKNRYESWDDLINYCRYSAMPVGRFVLDAHGESQRLWPANDALCAALQIINHLQDCAKDYRDLDRVYVPLDALASVGLDVKALGAPAASPGLRQVVSIMAHKNAELLSRSSTFSRGIADFRLGLEVAAIQRLAEQLNKLLMRRDPLSERVHFGKWRFTLIAAGAAAGGAAQRVWRRSADARGLVDNG